MENGWCLEKQFLHIFQRSEGDLEIPHQNWQTDGNPACGSERGNSQTNTLSEQTMEWGMREMYDDSQRTAWSEENLKAVIETPTEAEVGDN